MHAVNGIRPRSAIAIATTRLMMVQGVAGVPATCGTSFGMLASVMTIAEYLDSEGRPVRVRLGPAPQAAPAAGEVRVRLESDDGVSADLPLAMLATVMRRYGKPLDLDDGEYGHAAGQSQHGPALDLGGDCRLACLRYRALVDASSRDYLVWSEPGHAPIAALGNGIAAALRHLAQRLGQR